MKESEIIRELQGIVCNADLVAQDKLTLLRWLLQEERTALYLEGTEEK